MKNLLCFAFLAGVGLMSLQANPFTWTGNGGNGDWTNSANWSAPNPNFSADTATLNQYLFTFNLPVQTTQNMGGVARRFSRLTFSNGDFTLNNGSADIILGQSTGGFVVESGNQMISGGQFTMNAFTESATGGINVKAGSITLNASKGFSIAGSSTLRYLHIDGDGTIVLNGILSTNANGGTVRLRDGFGGRLVLNTGGSTIHTGDLQHRGTGVLELRADDALGTLNLRFENAAAKVESGGGSRVLSNTIFVGDGFILTGTHSMELAGSVNLKTGTSTVSVADESASLIFSGSISGAGGEFVKSGSGELTLSGQDTSAWSQEIRITAGRLFVKGVAGSATGQGNVLIEKAASLAGFGLIEGEVSVEGALAVGGPDRLTFGKTLRMQDESRIVLEHGGVAPILEGDLAFGEGVSLILSPSESWQVGQTYRLFELVNGEISGVLGLAGPGMGEFTYQSGPNGYVDFTLTAIPEPRGFTLFGVAFGIGGVVLFRRGKERDGVIYGEPGGRAAGKKSCFHDTPDQFTSTRDRSGHKQRISNPVSGFSLIEILMTASLVTVLVLIGVGVMGQMRSSARSTSCVSNLRAHANAATLFSMENNGIFPSDNVRAEIYPYLVTAKPVDGTKTIRHWQGPLEHKSSNSQTVCKEMMALMKCTHDYPSYAMNQYLTSSYAGGVVQSWQKHRYPVMVNEPSLIYFFMDAPAVGVDSLGNTYFRSLARVANDFLFPHNNGLNIAFVDGHVQWRDRAVFLRPENTDLSQPGNPWQPL